MGAATICSEAPGITVILFKRTPGGFTVCGHGAALDFATACRKAAVEMERHKLIIARFVRIHAGKVTPQLPDDAHPIECRSLFFAPAVGHKLILVRQRSAPCRTAVRHRLVFDGPVPGPWTRYADAWRVV